MRFSSPSTSSLNTLPNGWRVRFALFALTIAAATLASNAIAGDQAENPPTTNVVIIYADDLGYGDLACYGHPHFKTPHLDQMAREGARLTNFYSSCPYCAPSRASLLTGRYPFRNGMVRNPAPDAGINDVGIGDDEILLGEIFSAAGYATACYGKWHLGHNPQFYPTRHGFDEYFGILYSNDMRPVQLMQNEEVFEEKVDQRYLTKRYTERALSFIERNRNKPFFLYLPHAMPHKPLAASEEFYQQSGGGLYGDVIAELDWGIGQVLDKLKSLGLDENTLVLFTSDNGPWYGGSAGGLRGMKGQWWEGGVRVPLIARWPGKIPAGHANDEPAIIMDLFTTAINAVGLETPKDRKLDGRDIMPLLTGDAKSPHDALFAVQGGAVRTVRIGDWKLHGYGTPPPDRRGDDWVDPRAPDGETIIAQTEQARPSEFPGVETGDESPRAAALFNLRDDPSEQKNVAADHPQIAARLQAVIDRMKKESEEELAKRNLK